MKKIMIVLIALIAIGISIGAVSAEGFSFSFGSDSNSDGGSIEVNNNELKIQGEKYTIPDWYKENESARILAGDVSAQFGEDSKVTTCELNKDNNTVLIKVFFANDGEFSNLRPSGPDAQNKTIGGHAGFLTPKDNLVLFDYQQTKDKVIEISAPDEQTVEAVLKA